MKELLKYCSFVRFWFARVATNAGTQMLLLATSWHMYELTASTWDLGLVGLFQLARSLATALLAGHLADRHHRARLVATCTGLQACAVVFLAAIASGGGTSRKLLLVLSALLDAVRPFQMSAQQALVPTLVSASLLLRAVALSSSGVQLSVIGGPALSGLLFTVEANGVYCTCAVLFCIAEIICLFVCCEHVPSPREPVSARILLASARFIGSSPLLLGAVSLDLFAVLLGGATALLPIFTKRILHVGPQGLGLLRSAPAVGALVVGLALVRCPVGSWVERKLLISVAMYGMCTIVFGLLQSFLLSLFVFAVAGGADMVSVVIGQTLVQLQTPNHVRGRVAAFNSLFIGASNQLGEFESGITAAMVGPFGSVVLGGIGTIFVSLAWLRLFKPLAARNTMNLAYGNK